MITRAQALTLHHRQELHAGECRVTIGPRGGRTSRQEVWRINGAVKTWKTDPARFQVPLKFGFNGPYTYLDETNAHLFHLSEDCQPTITDHRLKPKAVERDCMRCEETFADVGEHEHCPACRANMNRTNMR